MEQRAEKFAFRGSLKAADHQLEAEIFGAGFEHVQRLRINALVNEKAVGFGFAHAVRHRHRFGGGGRFVQERGAGHFKAGQIDAHLLEVQQRFQAALGDFRLIGGVGGVPAGIFQHVAQNHIGQTGGVVAQPDIGFFDLVFGGDAFELGQRVGFGERVGQRHFAGHADALRHGVADKGRHVLFAQLGQQRGLVGEADVAGGKFVAVEQILEIHSNPLGLGKENRCGARTAGSLKARIL